MIYGILLFYVFVIVGTHPNESDDYCKSIHCVGEEYDCINDRCYCASGFIANTLQTSCVKCPGLGEKCFRTCCNDDVDKGSLYCWQGICRQCYDEYGNWICREPIDQVLIVSVSQIAMATALVLGILATFVLLYKLCITADVRALGSSSQSGSRLSIGSLQVYVNERLRDAPPRYSRAAPAGSSVYPAACFLNAGFVHDSSVPPPPYSPGTERKEVDTSHTENHI